MHEQDETSEPLDLDRLLTDPKSQSVVDTIIKHAARHYGLPPGYSLEDVRQRTLSKYLSWLRARGSTVVNPQGLLERIVRNTLTDLHRRHQSEAHHPREEFSTTELSEAEEPKAGSDEELYQQVFLSELRSFLSESDRALFDKHFILGETFKEIAEGRGITKQAVSVQWARLLKKLRPYIEATVLSSVVESRVEETRGRLRHKQDEVERLEKENREVLERMREAS